MCPQDTYEINHILLHFDQRCITGSCITVLNKYVIKALPTMLYCLVCQVVHEISFQKQLFISAMKAGIDWNKKSLKLKLVSYLNFWKMTHLLRFQEGVFNKRSAILADFFSKDVIYEHLVRIKRGYNSSCTSRYSDEAM